MLTSRTYVVAYDEAIDNCLDISRQLSDGGISHKIFNVSSLTNQNENWVSAEDCRYYGHFFNAISDFLGTDADVFIFNAGDVQYDDYAMYTSRIEFMYFQNPNLALFSPEVTNSVYSGWGSYIAPSVKYPELYLSTNTDGLYLSMSREMAEHMHAFYSWSIETGEVDFSTMRSGWGLDHAYCSLALYLNKIIYRDSLVALFHPVGQSYSYDQGVEEFYKTIRSFIKFAEQTLGADADRLKEITNLTLGKIKEQNMSPLTIERVYSDPEALRSA